MTRLVTERGYNFGTLTTLFGELGPLLRHLRRRAERSQAEAATVIGKTPRVISGYESGEIAPSGDTLDRLLVFYGIADLVQLQAEIDALRSGAPAPSATRGEKLAAAVGAEFELALSRQLAKALERIDALEAQAKKGDA